MILMFHCAAGVRDSNVPYITEFTLKEEKDDILLSINA